MADTGQDGSAFRREIDGFAVTVPVVRPRTQGDAGVFAMHFDEGFSGGHLADGPGGTGGFRPSDRISDVPASHNASR